MTLWTYQIPAAWRMLLKQGQLIPKWRFVSERWEPAFVWMSERMIEKGICTRLTPPIWAWYSCCGDDPLQEAAEMLLCHDGSTYAAIEFEAPENLVLLSYYHPWGCVLDAFADPIMCGLSIQNEGFHRSRVLDVNPALPDPGTGGIPGDIQACLPYIRKSWIRGVSFFTMPEYRANGDIMPGSFPWNCARGR